MHRDQHFFSRNTGLTCCAAPIFDYRGDLVAVLDASGESDRAQQHMFCTPLEVCIQPAVASLSSVLESRKKSAPSPLSAETAESLGLESAHADRV